MGRPFVLFLDCPRVYSCANCRAHAADHDDIISKAFQGRHGRAYLFNNVINITLGPKEDRLLITGLHTVSDIYCTCCNAVLGWKYEQAFEESQKYKEGKFIIEKARVMKSTNRPFASVVVECYQEWCGPCKAIQSTFKRLYFDLGDRPLKFYTANADKVSALQEHKGKCRPSFFFYKDGAILSEVHGVNAPQLTQLILDLSAPN